MPKKSNEQLYDEFLTHADVANNPYRTPYQFQTVYQNSRLKWFKLKYKDFERTEAVRADLRPFIRSKEFGKGNIIPIAASEIKLEYITAVNGIWTFQCNGKNTERQLPIVPKPIDVANAMVVDPFRQPDDTEPIYIERNEGEGFYLQILSANWPSKVFVHYLKEPEPFNLLDDPGGFTEEEEMQQNEILDMALGRHELITENMNRYQALQNEIQSKGV